MKNHDQIEPSPSPIVEKVWGTTEIHISDSTPKHVEMTKHVPYFYEGKVRCGAEQLGFREAAMLAFKIHHSDRALTLHHCLNLFKHPNILSSLGYGFGSGKQEGYIFLAFPSFESTFANFLHKSCDRTVELKRFTEEFIGLVRCIVYGLLELHKHGYYCPKLNEEQILILKEQNSISAKLWDFCSLGLGNEKVKDMDWVRLGNILDKTATNHKSHTPEIADLCKHIKEGTLKGIDILKHSALLSVRAKFDNVLALNTFALAHFSISSQTPSNIPNANDFKDPAVLNQLFCDSSDKDKTIAAFKILLDSDVGWTENIPAWIQMRNRNLGFSPPRLNTFRHFLWKIRSIIEHENSYVPPSAEQKISSCVFQFSNIQPDLEYEFRQSWPYLFLISQKFATSLQLKNS